MEKPVCVDAGGYRTVMEANKLAGQTNRKVVIGLQLRHDPKPIETVKRGHDGMIHVSGEGRGYVATEKTYRDYHLIVEYKWGERVDGSGKVI